MQYIAPHYCSKFQKDLTAFGGVMTRKPPRSKIHNLATTNAILTKLSTIMYLHKIFNLAENRGLMIRRKSA